MREEPLMGEVGRLYLRKSAADGFLVALARLEVTGKLSDEDLYAVGAVQEILGDALLGREALEAEHLSFSEAENVVVFTNFLTSALPGATSAEGLAREIKTLREYTKTLLKERSLAPENIGRLERFFESFAEAQLEEIEEVEEKAFHPESPVGHLR